MMDEQFSVTIEHKGRKIYCVVLRGERPDAITYIICALGLKKYYDLFEIGLSEQRENGSPTWQQQHEAGGDEPIDQAFIDNVGVAIVAHYS